LFSFSCPNPRCYRDIKPENILLQEGRPMVADFGIALAVSADTSVQQIIMKIVTEEAAPVTKLRKAVLPNVAGAVVQVLGRAPSSRLVPRP
jgi:serine/threonine protein kinase